MNKCIYVLTGLLFCLSLKAQSQTEFRVYLKDKGSSLELLESPERFLSTAALSRRALQNIPINNRDLPIAKEYKQTLNELGAIPMAHSKWLNYVYVSHPQPALIASLPFVERIEFSKRHQSFLCGVNSGDTLDYGFANGQIEMLNGDLLHQEGYTGTGITIAVIDAGYEGFIQSSAFDSLRTSQRLLGTFNYISNDSNVFSGWGSHGTSVLSIMAANLADTMIGTAPDANYWLFTTENIHQETPLEMDHWVMAAEFADSVGAQVINTSLSYQLFDDPQDNYSYSDMDGNTTVITRAADIAASKGILIVAGAGNEGGTSQPHIAAPADGDSVLTVGAVNWQGDYASLSSIGPSFDNRVKPDVMAQGSPTTLIDGTGNFNADFGTSYAAPLVAGLAACLIEAYPSKHSEEIANYIRESAHLYATPNDSMGYGIPDFQLALSLYAPEYLVKETEYKLYPNPVQDHIIIDATTQKNWAAELRILDLSGRCIVQKDIQAYDAYRLNLNLKKGSYIIQLTGDINGIYKFQSQ
ncbi:subtilisin-like serine protease [Owenweeksia hongkongensis DSM 17368]|uniref:Subtilisin-like serine protease n=1 Tax=Owenweeksia hongkongensis (strain DSM 17368 / CIP 108786 / JCM 12287 / NRRL B-23963 / UST20020801) TaxID=926562 RepID=G8R7Z6_OWEHD|nr:S8 family serine peptidase [Owenweeksia hongkongensis]AEV31319.1 subtilisin-like serine protease [Owenweeksia hongkongensis DSM 17368]